MVNKFYFIPLKIICLFIFYVFVDQKNDFRLGVWKKRRFNVL